jgi:dTDP-4-dehydrorhamnose reductase
MKTKVAIIGSRGLLGSALCRAWQDSCEVLEVHREILDLREEERLASFMDSVDAEWLFNCSGLTSLEACENSPDLADLLNRRVPWELAKTCEKKRIRFVHFSTDYVFDGRGTSPYTEEDPTSPESVYGISKLAGETAVLSLQADAFVFRVSWLFGPGRAAFPDQILQRALAGCPLEAVCDKWASPTHTLDLAHWLHPHSLANFGESGLFHACNAGECSWFEYAEQTLDFAADLGLPIRSRAVTPIPIRSLPQLQAPRPPYSVLNTSKLAWHLGFKPRSWQSALKEYLHDVAPR